MPTLRRGASTLFCLLFLWEWVRERITSPNINGGEDSIKFNLINHANCAALEIMAISRLQAFIQAEFLDTGLI